LLPQLHNLQIIDCGRLEKLGSSPVFGGRSFTQRVRTLSVPSNGHTLLKDFVNATHVVYLFNNEVCVKTVRCLASCGNLHRLEGDLSWPRLLSSEPGIMKGLPGTSLNLI